MTNPESRDAVPATAAGKALLDWADLSYGNRPYWTERILAIEAEARQDSLNEVERLLPYVVHFDMCALNQHDRVMGITACTCGLTAARALTTTEAKPKP
jgi:hypothetical protein